MNSNGTFKNINPIYLGAPITEVILLSCINGSSFSKINLNVQKVMPLSKLILKKYIFHLVDNSFILYHGAKRKYLINTGGFELLNRIYSHRKSRKIDYAYFVIQIN